MKRDIIVSKLMKEGFSEKTLVNFTDKQLNHLAERILGENLTTTLDAIKKSPALQAAAKDPKQSIKLVGEEDIEEGLKGNQKKIDKNKNGKIDAEDFKLLKSKKKKDEKSEVKEWVKTLAEENFHSFTSKNEIMELINVKLNEAEVAHEPKVPEFMSYNSIKSSGPAVAPTKPKTSPGTKPGTSPGKPKPRTPYEPGIGPKHKPKAGYGIKEEDVTETEETKVA